MNQSKEQSSTEKLGAMFGTLIGILTTSFFMPFLIVYSYNGLQRADQRKQFAMTIALDVIPSTTIGFPQDPTSKPAAPFKIMLADPPALTDDYDKAYPNLGLLQLISYLREHTPLDDDGIVFLDQFHTVEDHVALIEEHKPNVYGISFAFLTQRVAYHTINELKRRFPEMLIIAGGPHPTSVPNLVMEETAADVVCIGEKHDSRMHHRLQLQVIRAMMARDDRLGVGMEMFQRPAQPHIDAYFKGDIDEAKFLEASEYAKRWGYSWSLYRPIVEFCRKNDLPLAALNAPKELTKRVSKLGYAALNEDEKKQLGDIDFHVKPHRDYWMNRLAKIHGKSEVGQKQKIRSYEVMTVWDGYMAASAAKFQQDRQIRRMVLLAGGGHIERGFGIPRRTVKRTGGKVVTVSIVAGADVHKALAKPTTDFIIMLK
ncbi:MAG: ChaN family lipoprotein [Planctomycetes bacterium]|nr:ChaN family lipoprotein [Planctomycetota bacterium]